jgi:MFS transporter, DHA1 family, inner membrane transport protein
MAYLMSPAPYQTFAKRQLLAIFAIGTVGGVMVNLQPLLLGDLVREGRLSAVQLGQAAMLELLGMAISIGIAGNWMPLRSQRAIFIAVGSSAALCNVWTLVGSGVWILVSRGFAGLLEGVMLWLTVALYARVEVPARMNAIYLFVLASTGFLLASLVSLWLMPTFGSLGGFACITLMNLSVAAWAPMLPSSFVSLGGASKEKSRSRGAALPGIRGCVGLMALFSYIAAVLSVWIYISPLGFQSGITSRSVNAALTLAIGAEILGALTASVMAGRLKYRNVLAVGIPLSILLCALLWHSLPGWAFIATTMGFGFLWYFLMPFLMPFVIAADPTKKAAMLSGSSQMFGCAAGPFVASLVVTQSSSRPAVIAGGALFAFTLLLITGVDRQRGAG